jgi:hypothetical protein
MWNIIRLMFWGCVEWCDVLDEMLGGELLFDSFCYIAQFEISYSF